MPLRFAPEIYPALATSLIKRRRLAKARLKQAKEAQPRWDAKADRALYDAFPSIAAQKEDSH
jgi:hypothetical protein